MDTMLSPLLSCARSLDELLRFDRFIVVGANSGGDQVRRRLARGARKSWLSPTCRRPCRARYAAGCRLYAAHDPNWVIHIHYIAVPEERAEKP